MNSAKPPGGVEFPFVVPGLWCPEFLSDGEAVIDSALRKLQCRLDRLIRFLHSNAIRSVG